MIKEALRPIVVPVREFSPIKTIIGAFERSNLVQNLALDFVRWKNSSHLTESERTEFKKAIEKIKKGERVSFSELGGIIKRNGTEISGADCLDGLQNTAVLVLSNHPTHGPLNGWAHMLITSSKFRERTGKEILWAHGEDRSTFQDLAREKLSKFSESTILVRGSDAYEGTRRMVKAFNDKNAVGIHPEGDGHDKLGRAVADAGHLIFRTAYRNIPVICSAGFFDPKTGQLNISFFRISREKILEFKDSNGSRQEVADFVMAEIAKRLPPEKRGFYS